MDTPTRAAVLTGRIPVRHGMSVVGMPHEFSGLRAEEVTIAEVLSEAGYATAFCGKGHLGDIEDSYLHNQGFDEALFTPMNQITSLYDPMGGAANAVLGLTPVDTSTISARMVALRGTVTFVPWQYVQRTPCSSSIVRRGRDSCKSRLGALK